ncbi:SprT-like family-domain-containing protein [Xylariaceae sp. FL0662B]|nr:SprT-like family-domain-containing protein [Xylariaceae sp. FL0662B]
MHKSTGKVVVKMLEGMLGSSSEDEFPDIDVVIRRYKNRTQLKQGTHGEGNKDHHAPATTKKPDNIEKSAKLKAASASMTPLRRRKLGQTQAIHGSLLKPWNELEAGEEETAQISKSRSVRRRVREGSAESNGSYNESSDLLPVKPRQASSRISSLRRNMDSSTGGVSKKPSSLAVRMEEATKSKKASDKSSKHSDLLDDSEEELDAVKSAPQSSGDEASEFVSNSDSETDGWKSDSQLFLTPTTRRSGSPSARLAKPQRTLSWKDPAKKESRGNGSKKTQPGTTITDPTKPSPSQREDSNPAANIPNASQRGNLEDAFKKLQIFNEDSDSEDEPSIKGAGKKPILEPTTPRKTLPPSPHKTPRIPVSPWKPEHKEFWDPEANFAWIDQHSPAKKKLLDLATGTGSRQEDTDDKAEMLKRKYGTSPEKRDAKRAFDARKEELARSFLAELDARITDGRLAKLTADTGGLQITWSNSLLTTAGRAHWKCKTVSTTTGNVTANRQHHHASIELATKVLANEADLLNTVAHEFCHRG